MSYYQFNWQEILQKAGKKTILKKKLLSIIYSTKKQLKKDKK